MGPSPLSCTHQVNKPGRAGVGEETMDNEGGAYGGNWLKVPFSNVEILLSL